MLFILAFVYSCTPSDTETLQTIEKDTIDYFSFTAEDDSAFIAENYTKQEYRIKMRDGIELFTSVYSPKDTSKAYPILLKRTPYSVRPYGEDFAKTLGSSMLLARDLYIFVYQDVRGRFMSEGEFEDMTPDIDNKTDSIQTDESSDTYDTIDWLVKNIKNNNGRVGMWGNSYPGFYAASAAIDNHPALKITVPQCPIADWFWDDFHHNGAFFPAHFLGFFQYFGQVRTELSKTWPAPLFEFDTKDGYEFYKKVTPLSKVNELLYDNKIEFWNQVVAHPNYDEFWQSKNRWRMVRCRRPLRTFSHLRSDREKQSRN